MRPPRRASLRALAISRDYPFALFGLGEAKLAQGREEEACADFERALALDPSFHEARYDLSRARSALVAKLERADGAAATSPAVVANADTALESIVAALQSSRDNPAYWTQFEHCVKEFDLSPSGGFARARSPVSRARPLRGRPGAPRASDREPHRHSPRCRRVAASAAGSGTARRERVAGAGAVVAELARRCAAAAPARGGGRAESLRRAARRASRAPALLRGDRRAAPLHAAARAAVAGRSWRWRTSASTPSTCTTNPTPKPRRSPRCATRSRRRAPSGSPVPLHWYARVCLLSPAPYARRRGSDRRLARAHRAFVARDAADPRAAGRTASARNDRCADGRRRRSVGGGAKPVRGESLSEVAAHGARRRADFGRAIPAQPVSGGGPCRDSRRARAHPRRRLRHGAPSDRHRAAVPGFERARRRFEPRRASPTRSARPASSESATSSTGRRTCSRWERSPSASTSSIAPACCITSRIRSRAGGSCARCCVPAA